MPSLISSLARRPVVAFPAFLLLICVLLAGAAPRTDAASLPADVAALVPADAQVLLTFASLDEVDRFWSEMVTSFADAAGDVDSEEPGFESVTALLTELSPDLMAYAETDRPLALAMTFGPPMMQQPVVFTLAVPVREEALNPPLLRTLTGEAQTRIAGRYIGITTGAAYAEAKAGSPLTSDLLDGTVAGRADLASLVAIYRPLMELGLMAMSQATVAAQNDTTGAAAPQLTPEQLGGIQEAVRGLMDGIQRLDLALDQGGTMPRLQGALTVTPGGMLDPGVAQPDFERALALTRHLPPHVPLVEAGAIDLGAMYERWSGLYTSLAAAGAEDMPPEVAEAYTRWMVDVLELQQVWTHPFALGFGASAGGIRLYGVMEHPDAGDALDRIIDAYTGIEEVGIGLSFVEGPEQSLAGVRVRAFDIEIDPEQMAAMSHAAMDEEEREEMEEAMTMVANIYPTIRVATTRDHLLVCADPDPAAMGDLIQAVKSDQGRLREDVRDAAARAADGTQLLVVGDIRHLVVSVLEWLAFLDEPLPEVPEGDAIPVIVTEGFRENVWNFSLETDLASMMALFAALDEWSDKQDALHDAEQESAVGGDEAGPDEEGPDEEGD